MGKVEYPADHKAGMPVTKGGSSCANCRYLRPKLTCANEYFQKWNDGSNKIPTKSADSYCSDFWEPREGRKTLSEQVQDRKAEK